MDVIDLGDIAPPLGKGTDFGVRLTPLAHRLRLVDDHWIIEYSVGSARGPTLWAPCTKDEDMYAVAARARARLLGYDFPEPT